MSLEDEQHHLTEDKPSVSPDNTRVYDDPRAFAEKINTIVALDRRLIPEYLKLAQKVSENLKKNFA